MKQTKQQKADSARISAAFYATCAGVQVSILDMPRIVFAGQTAINSGATDDKLAETIRAFVETIRKN
jgi:hypothetical protein